MTPPDLPPRRGPGNPLVTDDGFGDHAIALDPETGCHLWQGNMNGPEPRAGYRMTVVKPRILAFERAYGPVPKGYRLDHCPHADRCVRPDHQITTLVGATHPADAVEVRRTLAGRLPAERPPHVPERDWAALCGVVAGKTFAEVGAELGVSRQRVHQLVERALQQLSHGTYAMPARSSNVGSGARGRRSGR